MTTSVWFGDRAVLVTCADRVERRSVLGALARALPRAEAREGVRSVLVVSSAPDPGLLEAVNGVVGRHVTARPSEGRTAAEILIDVRYDGIDLDRSATALGLTVEQLVTAHTRQAWEVDVMGFAPGFGYLVPVGAGEAEWTRLPRRDRPRESVPRGSVAIAAGMSAVYPAAMPGGWHLLGTTDRELFDPAAVDRPSVLVPGARVRFRAVG